MTCLLQETIPTEDKKVQERIPPPPTRPPSVLEKAGVIENAAVINKKVETEDRDEDKQAVEAKEVGSTTSPQQKKKQAQRTDRIVGVVREAAGERWVDPNLAQWPEGDFRIFVGNLGPEVFDSQLCNSFKKYTSFQMGKVVRGFGNKSKGYGFVSFGDPKEGAQALREMHGQYIGYRPCHLKKAQTESRTVKDKSGRAVKRSMTVHNQRSAKFQKSRN